MRGQSLSAGGGIKRYLQGVAGSRPVDLDPCGYFVAHGEVPPVELREQALLIGASTGHAEVLPYSDEV